MRAARVVPWVAVAAAGAACAGAGVLLALGGSEEANDWVAVPWLAATLASMVVGLVLARRCARNPIGWLLLANGLTLAATALAEEWARYAVSGEPGALPAAGWAVLVTERAWPLLFAFMAAIAWIFPDGRLPSRRWRPYAYAAGLSFAVLVVLSLLAAERFAGPYANVDSPLPELSESVIGVPLTVSLLGALAGLIGGAVAVLHRLRHASGIERLQLKWLAYAAGLVPACIAICLAEIAIAGDDGAVTGIAVSLALTTVPSAIGVAVLRYRLYAIDRLINRTLVYAAMSIALATVFVAVSLVLGTAIGSGSTLRTAAATLAVALLFGPLRTRLQLIVDRRFARERYEGLRTVKRFLEDLRAGRADPEATGGMLADALDDPSLELLFWLPDARVHVDAAGRPAPLVERAGSATTPVRRGSFHVATVVHDAALVTRPDLLESVLEAAGFALEIARLRVEVRRQLAEVEASRARIVTAGYEERRRLERDLHDGVQQRLVSIGLGLRHVQGRMPADSVEATALDATVAELAGAIDELRELARGVRPAGLDDGLAPALRELASRSRLRPIVDATADRFADQLETAAYFVASEALANAAKYAQASRVAVSATRSNGSLVVSVSDDGVGGARPSTGSGLAGISDRISALGGRVTVVSPPGEGTVVTAVLPCAS